MASDTKKARYDVIRQVKDAMERDDWAEVARILSECSHRDSDSIMTQLVSRDQWDAVKRCVGDEERTWDIGGVLVKNNILLSVAEGNWRVIGEMPHEHVLHSTLEWIIQQACTRAQQTDIVQYVLPNCDDDQLDSVLTTLVERRLWLAVVEILKRPVSDSVERWAVMETCKHIDDSVNDNQEYIIFDILHHCAADQLDSVLTTLVERRLWLAVVEILKRPASESVKKWAIARYVESDYECNKGCLIEDILPYCTDDQLNFVLTKLVEHREWWHVKDVLEQGVSDSVKRWAVMETCKHLDDSVNDNQEYIIYDILPHCAADQLDSVLTTLVERRMWVAVGEVLQLDVSDSLEQWAVMETCTHCDKLATDDVECIVEDILPYCADDQLDSVLTTLVERRMWVAVRQVLSQFNNDFVQQFVVEKICGHCSSIGVYLRDDHNSPIDPFTPDDLLLFTDDELDLTQYTFITRNTCTAVRYESHREVSDSQRRVQIKNAFLHADQENLIRYILPYFVYDSIRSALKKLASRCFWKAFSVLLHHCIIDTLCMWTLVTLDIEPKEKVFLDMIRNPCDAVKQQIPSFWRLVNWSDVQCYLSERLNWDTLIREVLCEVLLGAVKEMWLSGRWKELPSESTDIMGEASVIVTEFQQLIKQVLMECSTNCVTDLLPKIQKGQHRWDENRSRFCPMLAIYFTKRLVQEYYKRKAWQEMTNAIMVVLTTVPVVPDVQTAALRVMLRHNRWDIVRHACLSGVCEQDRRQLFQVAVKQRQWSAVKRWADHTLYDDQRLWALGEARQAKRWDVYLKLADHGLSEWERVGVLFRVTMHADWKIVRHMLKTVGDVTDMIDLLTNTPGTLSKLGTKKYEERMSDLREFKKFLTKDTNTLKTLKTLAKRGKWYVVLHNIRHKPNLQHARRALKAAVSSEAWHAVMQLVRLETDVTRRDSLFRDMIRLRQWAVCRELLEQGVSHDLSLELLPELIEHCQWTLVAMAMECTMDDDRRKKIMHQAIMTREGSVVWECVIKLQTRLSVDEREDLFQLAFNREVWQAVKPLIEEKDENGIRHRDTALLEAIEQHQWDVVDHCQRHHADINMKDDDGHTPIHRAARKGDWEAVKELTVRDGDPNLLDSEGLSVLHRAIIAEQWDAVKLLIQYHGHIHQAAQNKYDTSHYSRTPLGMLIDARQRELIELTLMWCPDQWKSVSRKRETALHAAFLSGWLDLVYYLIARRVDPLAVTKRGLTALCYAVLCNDCPQRIVAECIKLGFSTHQSRITATANSDWGRITYSPSEERIRLFRSPLVLAVIRGLPAVTQMLYESGACSNRQLFEVNTYLSHIPNYVSTGGGSSQYLFTKIWNNVHRCELDDSDYSFDTEAMKKSADYLHQVSSTPRSLVSTCRLVISHCLTLSKTRHRDIAQLPLSPMMKDYLMFTDLTDPRYHNLSHRGKE